MGFFGWVFLGGFFNANPGADGLHTSEKQALPLHRNSTISASVADLDPDDQLYGEAVYFFLAGDDLQQRE